MSEIKLLPCPFCGGKADVIKNGTGCFQVRCDICEVKQYAYAHKTEENAIKAWNTRKPMDNIEKQLENASYWTDSTFDEDGYCNDDSNEVVDLHRAIDIIRAGGKE